MKCNRSVSWNLTNFVGDNASITICNQLILCVCFGVGGMVNAC